MSGWIKLHRKLLTSTIFQNPNLFKFWIWCLLKATHCDRATRIGLQEIDLKLGQFIFGRNVAAMELSMNHSTVYKYLNCLENEGLITTNRNNRFTVVTVVNWEIYQDGNSESNNKVTTKEQQSNNKRTTKEQQKNTDKNYKNYKNEKNDKNILPYPLTEFGFSGDLESKINTWVDYKAEKKDSYKPIGFKSLLGTIKRNADQYGEQAIIDLIDMSMTNNWKGITWDKIKKPESNKAGQGTDWLDIDF